MAQTPTSGYGTYANYGYEETYGAGAVSARTFGRNVKLTISRRNNMERSYGIGARNASTVSALKYEGEASVEFSMANGSFWRAVLGSVADAGDGPYTHTYTEANTLPSFAIDTGTELGTNDEVTELKGCKVSSATLTATVGEVVKVRLECPYKTETLTTAGIGSQVAETEEPFTFAQGTLELPNGTAIGNVQSVEITVSHDLEMLYGLGSRLATGAIEKRREYNISMTVAFDDTTDLLTKFLGDSGGPLDGTPTATATLELTFTNGGAGAAERSMVLLFANVYLDEETLPKDVEEIIKENVTGFALSCTSIVYTNNTESDDDVP